MSFFNRTSSIIGGQNNFIGEGCDRVTLINCVDCRVIGGASGNASGLIPYGASGLVALNCSGKVFTRDDSYKTFLHNERILPNTKTTAQYDAVNPTIVDGTYKYYEVDLSGGDAAFQWDIEKTKNCEIILKVITAGNDIVIVTESNAEEFEQTPLPFTITAPSVLSTYRIWSNGTDLFYT